MSNLSFWRGPVSPFRDFAMATRSLEKALGDRWFDDVYGAKADMSYTPNVEVKETTSAYMLSFDLPGLTKDQVKIDLNDNTLTVSGERKTEKRTDDKTTSTHFSEFTYGAFSRSFTFPVKVNAENVDAKLENGVLTVELAKTTQNPARSIQIK